MPILNMTGGGSKNPFQPFHLNGISDLAAVEGNTQATITWTDAGDLIIDGQTLATWGSTKLVRKTGSAPADSSDGTLVVTETVKDTYKNSGYVDTGLTNGTTYYYGAFGVSSQGLETISNIANVTPRAVWHPGANTIGYYTMDNDILNHATIGSTFPDGDINTATFSTTRVHGSNTKSLYCSGSTYAYLPASSEFAFGTSDFTVSFWIYSETNSQWNPGIICNYATNSDHNQGWRIVDRMSNANNLSFCWKAGNSYVDNTSGISIYNDGWHNVVLTRSSGNFYLYLDGNTTPKIIDNSHAAYSIGRNANICFGYNLADGYYSKVYLNDVIFEDVAWSAQDVSDYYDLTK